MSAFRGLIISWYISDDKLDYSVPSLQQQIWSLYITFGFDLFTSFHHMFKKKHGFQWVSAAKKKGLSCPPRRLPDAQIPTGTDDGNDSTNCTQQSQAESTVAVIEKVLGTGVAANLVDSSRVLIYLINTELLRGKIWTATWLNTFGCKWRAVGVSIQGTADISIDHSSTDPEHMIGWSRSLSLRKILTISAWGVLCIQPKKVAYSIQTLVHLFSKTRRSRHSTQSRVEQ